MERAPLLRERRSCDEKLLEEGDVSFGAHMGARVDYMDRARAWGFEMECQSRVLKTVCRISSDFEFSVITALDEILR